MSQSSSRKSGGLLKGQLGIKSFFTKKTPGSNLNSEPAADSLGRTTQAAGKESPVSLKENVENSKVVCSNNNADVPAAASKPTKPAHRDSIADSTDKVPVPVKKKKDKKSSSSGALARPRRASSSKKRQIVESDDDEAEANSGSEFQVSEEDSSDEEMSDLVAEVESESGEDDDGAGDYSEDEALEAKLKKVQQKKKALPRSSVKQTPAISRVSKALSNASNASPLSNVSTPGSLATPNGDAVTRAAEFDTRASARFPFLHPSKIMDKKKRRPSDPDYDPTTLYIPPRWFEEKPKPTPAQAQWWQFKADNFDAVLMFKMGKFYELFEMDAHTGVEVLGLSYMKGEQPHAGFPEATYAEKVERLVRAGKKAVVIEQTETPEGLAERNERRKRQGLKRDPVVMREKVAVVTKATITDGEMMKGAGGEIAYLASVADKGVVGEKAVVGMVVVDVAAARVIAGQFEDDELRSHLRAVLTALKPSEIVIPKGGDGLSEASRKVIKGILRGPLVDERPVGAEQDTFYSGEAFWRMLDAGMYFGGGENGDDAAQTGADAEMPALLRRLREDAEGGEQKYGVLSLALGGLLANLQRGMVDKWVFCASKWNTIEEVLGQVGRTSQGGEAGMGASMVESSAPGAPTTSMSSGRTVSLTLGGYNSKTMALDGAALENMEILENAEGGSIGSLLGALDHCLTPFGKRRLREWLCKPLFVVDEIKARQDAVRDLMGGAEESACEARRLLAGLMDIERSIVRICASGIGIGSLRETRAILYEDVSKKKIKAVYATLLDIRKTIKAVKAFDDVDKSAFLDSLIGSGSFPDVESPLNRLMGLVDWPEAERTGKIDPQEGVDEEYDRAAARVHQAQTDLDAYLQEARSEVGAGGKLVKMISLQKDPYVLEVPDHIQVPSGWSSMQGKKGFKRYMTDELRDLTAAMAVAKEEKEVAQTTILKNIMAKFAENRAVWLEAVDRIASLDALMSLAKAAACGDGPMCCPEFVKVSDEDASGGKPIFHATQLRHPAGISGGKGAFVPNDVHLGGDAAPFMLLTGPNMGGKSTIMRQVCLATVAAQIGAWVPADSLKLSPADALFVRMGAKDNLILGQSTFFIELSETAAALHRATKHSLVALDELGRGTATIDGSAIAGAVLEYLAETVGCRGVFATHYHKLADAYENDPNDPNGSKENGGSVQTMHMGCTVRTTNDAVDDIIFLYKLARGACPKSFGSNVAKLAGLPLDVVTRAATISARLEGGSEIQGLARAVSRALGDGAMGGVGVGTNTLKSLQRKVRL